MEADMRIRWEAAVGRPGHARRVAKVGHRIVGHDAETFGRQELAPGIADQHRHPGRAAAVQKGQDPLSQDGVIEKVADQDKGDGGRIAGRQIR